MAMLNQFFQIIFHKNIFSDYFAYHERTPSYNVTDISASGLPRIRVLYVFDIIIIFLTLYIHSVSYFPYNIP